MTTDLSEREAKIVGDIHEKYGVGNTEDDKRMDLFNNAQGRWAAVASGYRWETAVELCDSWARTGILMINNP